MQKITNCLWFDNQALEAAEFYVSVFGNSKILNVARYPGVGRETHGKEEGSVMTVDFELEGQRFLALNGGPAFQFNPAVSLMVNCETQEEVDRLWNALSAYPQAEACGWLKDRFGISWQITPVALMELMRAEDSGRRDRVFAAMMQMKKIDIAALEKAAGAA